MKIIIDIPSEFEVDFKTDKLLFSGGNMRRTKKIDNNCIEVIFRDGKPQRVYPNHDWWHIFLRLMQLEDLAEAKEVEPTLYSCTDDIHIVSCPNCNAEYEVEENEVSFFCSHCGQHLIVKEEL